jgi:prepilin-type N-terminal cleavage/methylation domain-containing protein
MKKISSRAGFTLIELLVAIAIIGILAAFIIVNVGSARQKAKIAQAQLESRNLYDAIILLENDTEEWPGHQPPNIVCTERPGGCPEDNELCDDGCPFKLSDGFGGLTQNDSSNPYYNWAGPYIPQIPLDPWGNEYFFDTDYTINKGTPDEKEAVVLGSYGPNGVGWNQYDEDDVIYIIREE